MIRFTLLFIVALPGLSMVTGQLPCDSFLRRLPAFAHYFTHCDCLRSEWTEWAAIDRKALPATQCPSLSALVYQRRQRVIEGQCQDIVENNTICEPELADRIILALGLGSKEPVITLLPVVVTSFNTSRHDPPIYCRRKRSRFASPPVFPAVTPTTRPSLLPGCFFRSTAPTLPSPFRGSREPEQVCLHVTVPHETGRRSVQEELKSPRINRQESGIKEVEPLPVDPIPFSVAEHGSRYRRQGRNNCQNLQHILFVLDTSGSIGETDFNKVTTLLGNLTTLFCNPIKVAVMTFDHEYYVEFCFNEYDNSAWGRNDAQNPIKTIPYIRPGVRYTHTGGAAKCVCDYMLSPTCGVPPDAGCIDVIFFTDGRSNDPRYDICQEVGCLHRRRGVDTFAIGVGNYNTLRMDCYAENDLALDEYHLFNFPNFTTLEEQFELVIRKLTINFDPVNPYLCANTATDPA